MNISDLSIKRPTIVVVMFAVLTFLGYMSFRSLKYELFPKFTSPLFTVVTVYPGAGPSEVENSVSKKIEEVMAGLTNIEVVRTISQEGISIVIVTLKTGADVDAAVNDAVRKVQALQSVFPPQVQTPVVSQRMLGDFPVITLSVNAEMPSEKLFDELNYSIKPALAKIDGVGEINLLGGTEREIQINVDQVNLNKRHISILQIVQAIQNSNMEFPAGKISNNHGQTLLRMSGRFTSVSDIADIVIMRYDDGSFVKLRDVAEVIDTQKDPSSIYRLNGVQAVGIQIKKQDEANTVTVCEGVKKEIKLLEQQYAQFKMVFNISNDNSLMILHAVRSVLKDLVIAIILVTLIMFLFLHGIRNALVVMIAVPLSLISSLVGIKLAGYTLNLMTLVAMSLVIGTLVDDAIVVLENIYRHLEMGKSRIQATIDGVKEIGLSVISLTLVLIVVFLPVALSRSIISPMIAPFAMTIVISVIVSLLVAFTVVPLLTSRISRLEKVERRSVWGLIVTAFENGISVFSDMVTGFLQWSLRHPWITTFFALILFVSSIMLVGAGFIGSEFGNFGDTSEGIITLEYPQTYTFAQNNKATCEIENAVSKHPEVLAIYSSVGSSSGMLSGGMSNYKSEIYVKLVNQSGRKESSALFIKRIESELNQKFTDVKVRSAVVLPIGGTDEAPIQIVFRGTNIDTLFDFAERMRQQISRIPGTNNVKLSVEGGVPEIAIQLNKEKMARLDLTPEIVGATIQTCFGGNTDNQFLSGDYAYDINVRLDAFDRHSINDVENLTCVNNKGALVKLKQFAEINEQTGTSMRERYGRIPSVILESQALGRASGDIGNDIFRLLDNTKFPAGISYLPESDLKFQGDAFGSLGAALFIAVVLVYLTMVALYESYLYPFVVLFAIPLAIIGALWALALTGETLNLFTILGIIMLVGLVLKNAILVVDFTNTLRREQGMNVHDALYEAVKLRLRPILMTAGTTIIGMLPLALSHDSGSEWINGIGWVLIGGMASSTFLSLIVVPVLYLLAENIKSQVIGLFHLRNRNMKQES